MQWGCAVGICVACVWWLCMMCVCCGARVVGAAECACVVQVWWLGSLSFPIYGMQSGNYHKKK